MTALHGIRTAARTGALTLLTICSTTGLWANGVSQHLDSGPITHQVRRAISAIEIDGLLDEPAWSDALALELRFEVRPGENVTPPVRTICMVTYDDRNVYFAFRAHDPEPGRIRARYSDRDKAWGDDFVGVVLDTFNDERRAYELFSNPLGIQMDAVNDDVQHVYDDSWNAIWHSAGRVTDEGFDVEMAIPFNQIRFQPGQGEQTWGFDAIRSYPRSQGYHIGLFPRDRGNNSYLSQTEKLQGMAGASPGRNLELIPTLTASRVDARDDLPDGILAEGDPDAELGATLRWGITPSMTLNGAVNPDFSQVEADVLRVDINEQFALFYPETRPFFLEGADYFNTPMDLVYTRNIASPMTAAKLTGKLSGHTVGVFAAQDDLTSVTFPGAQGSSSEVFAFESSSAVGRYRYDFGENSTVGATVTDRRGEGYYNQVISADAVIRFTEADRLTLSGSTSQTQYNRAMVESMEVRDDAFRDHAFTLDYLHTVRDWWVNVEHHDYGEGFRSDLGWRPQVDVRRTWVGGARIWWGDEGDVYNRIAWGAGVFHSEQQDGEPIQDSIESWANVELPRESWASINITRRNRRYDGIDFDGQWGYYLSYNIQATRDLQLGIDGNFGDWIDFSQARPATQRSIRPWFNYNAGRHLLLTYRHNFYTLDIADGRLFSFHAPEVRTVFQFNRRAYVRAVLQYVDVERDPALYEDEVDRRTQDLFTQLLFAYKVNAQTAIYAGYSDNFVATEEFDLTRAGRSFYLKLSYAWSL